VLAFDTTKISVLFISILWHSQGDNHPKDDLAKFGYQQNMKGNFKHPYAYILATHLKYVWKSYDLKRFF
jgi:hypothetical protein